MRALFLSVILFLSALPTAFAKDYSQETKRAETLGKIIYGLDTAAWVATDEMLADPGFDTIKNDVRGWLSFKNDKTYETVFIADRDGALSVVYSATNKKKKIKSSTLLQEGRALTQREKILWQARATMLTQTIEHCPAYTPMNSVIFEDPDSTTGDILGYLFSASTNHGEAVFGKHYRFTISSDGETVKNKHAFSKSCLVVSSENVPKNAKAVALWVTHVVNNFPEEHHVFVNLSRNTPLHIGTSDNAIWAVKKGKIKLLE